MKGLVTVPCTTAQINKLWQSSSAIASVLIKTVRKMLRLWRYDPGPTANKQNCGTFENMRSIVSFVYH